MWPYPFTKSLAGDSSWDSIWADCPYATFFHSRMWATVWSEYTVGAYRPYPILLSFLDGSRLIIPLTRQPQLKEISYTHLLSPAGTYGGWIADHTITESKAAKTVELIGKLRGSLDWRANPFDPVSINAFTAYYAGQAVADTTHAIDLTTPFDVIFKQWTKGHKAAAKQAERGGVHIRQATTVDDWRAYYEIYLDSLRRWGDKATSKYEWRLFEILQSLGSDNITLWLAIHDSAPIAGALCFYAPYHAVYWHGAALEAHFKLRPAHLLVKHMISDAQERKCRWFDFNPSGGHEGVAKFKQGFGAQHLPAPYVRQQSTTYRGAGMLRRLRHMHLPLLKRGG